ncbi:MAG TPA: DinB family protein [Anaerolineae bacterium]
MIHPLVLQLRFARSEFQRGLAGLSEADAQKRILPMNCISWNVGHLAWQEQRYWLWRGQNRVLLPQVQERFAYGTQASVPGLAEAWDAWHAITAAADPWLDNITIARLQEHVVIDGRPDPDITFGSLMQRTIYHYWYHTGENLAIRQMLGHKDLPEFVGDIDVEAPYRPE